MKPKQIKKEARRIEALCLAKRWADAEVALRRMLAQVPNGCDRILQALGACYMSLNQPDKAIATFRKALEYNPGLIDSRNDLLFLLDQHPATTPADMRAGWQEWWWAHGAPLYAQRLRHRNNRDPERPLSVGYVSGDFRLHSAALGFGPFILDHTDAVRAYAYSTTRPDTHDLVTEHFQRHTVWRECSQMGLQQLVEQIQKDDIDILVDLSGNTNLNRMLAFCVKPAPVQVAPFAHGTWMGMAPVFDAFWTDAVVMPAAERAGLDVRLWDLPCLMAYMGPHVFPEPTPLPCIERGFVTFGSFNRALKVNDAVLRLWARVLEAVPGSRLLVKDATFTPEVQARTRAAMGAMAAQVDFVPVLEPQRDHMIRYGEVDLVLDTFPQTGGITALEGMYMGVPPITLFGERPNARASASFLTMIGLPDMVARTEDEYVHLAVDWVTRRREELSELRKILRGAMEDSPLNSRLYVPAVEAMYRTLWREWCARQFDA